MFKTLCALLFFVLFLCAESTFAQAVKRNLSKKTWPSQVAKTDIPASDGAIQPVMWYAAADSKAAKKPLLVVLHTWSSDYSSAGGDALCAEWCIDQGWAFIHPHFRGPNHTAEAMGSDRAVKDVVEAVEWIKQQTAIDDQRIYLIGGSGGAHMSLLMAGRHPEIWAAVSAWCGISDIAQWHTDCTTGPRFGKYARDIEAALGGSPANNAALKKDAWHRSPIAWLKNAASVPLDIAHGIHDGRIGSVPFVHSIHAFNAVVAEDKNAQIPEDQIKAFYETRQLPQGWPKAEPDPLYDAWTPLFVKTHGNTRLTIFEGGHELVHQAALNWLAKQRKGQPPVWKITDYIRLEVGGGETAK